MNLKMLCIALAAPLLAADPALEKMFDTKLTVAQRNDACFALRGQSTEAVREGMTRALKLDALRACAATNLRVAGAEAELAQALSAPEPEVRAVAARELGSFRKNEWLEKLAEAAGGSDLLVATNAIAGLSFYESSEVLPYLEALARKGGIAGILALDRIEALKDPQALAIARALLKTGDVPERAAAMRIVGEWGDSSDLPALRGIAANKEQLVTRQRGFGLMPAIDLSRAATATIAMIEKRKR